VRARKGFTGCAVQMDACVADPECTAYFTGAQPCNGGATCLATCKSMHSSGLVDASEVSACAATHCTGVCN
jgi:hypothetical protein